jgi:hypothetical protein
MSASRRITIARHTLAPGRYVDVDVSYPTFRDVARRYSLSVQPVTVRPDGISVYVPVEGYRATVENAPRFNARRLEALAADPAVLALADQMVARVREDEAAREAARVRSAWVRSAWVLPENDPRPF